MTDTPQQIALQVYTFQFTAEQVSVIQTALMELPGKHCLPILQTMTQQAARQARHAGDADKTPQAGEAA